MMCARSAWQPAVQRQLSEERWEWAELGLCIPGGVVDGPGEPIKDIPNQHTDPPAGRVC